MSLPEETFSWRSGGQAKSAVLERITLEEQLSGARARARGLAAERRARQQAGDPRGVADAVRRSREELGTIRQLQTQLAQPTSREAKLVGGRLDRRDVPLTPAEIEERTACGGTRSQRRRAAGRSQVPPSDGKPPPRSGPCWRNRAARTPRRRPRSSRPGRNPRGRSGTSSPLPVEASAPSGSRSTRPQQAARRARPRRGADSRSVATPSPACPGGAPGPRRPGTRRRRSAPPVEWGSPIRGPQAKVGKTEEITHGVDAQGRPITSSKSTSGGLTLTDQGLGANVGHSKTDQGCSTRSVTGGVTVDEKPATPPSRPATGCPARAAPV